MHSIQQEPQAPESALGHLSAQIAQSSEWLQTLAVRLDNAANRAFGAEPIAGADKARGPAAVPNGAIDQMRMDIEHLRQIIANVECAATRFDQLA